MSSIHITLHSLHYIPYILRNTLMSSIYIAFHFILLLQRNFDVTQQADFILAVFNLLADFIILAVFIRWWHSSLHPVVPVDFILTVFIADFTLACCRPCLVSSPAAVTTSSQASMTFQIFFQDHSRYSFLPDVPVHTCNDYDWRMKHNIRTSGTNISRTLIHWSRCWHCLLLVLPDDSFFFAVNKHFPTKQFRLCLLTLTTGYNPCLLFIIHYYPWWTTLMKRDMKRDLVL